MWQASSVKACLYSCFSRDRAVNTCQAGKHKALSPRRVNCYGITKMA